MFALQCDLHRLSVTLTFVHLYATKFGEYYMKEGRVASRSFRWISYADGCFDVEKITVCFHGKHWLVKAERNERVGIYLPYSKRKTGKRNLFSHSDSRRARSRQRRRICRERSAEGEGEIEGERERKGREMSGWRDGCSRDRNSLEAVSTLKGLHRDKFHLGATFHRGWRRLPFSSSQPCLSPASYRVGRGMGLGLARLERERLDGVAAVTQLRPHLICLKYTAPPAEVLMATRPHPLLRTTPSFFFPPAVAAAAAAASPRPPPSFLSPFRFSPFLTMPAGLRGGSRIIDFFFLFFFSVFYRRAIVSGNLIIAEVRLGPAMRFRRRFTAIKRKRGPR